MIRRTLAAFLVSVLLLCGFAARAQASASRTCFEFFVMSHNPIRVCMPFVSE